jgi:hypothetical protein
MQIWQSRRRGLWLFHADLAVKEKRVVALPCRSGSLVALPCRSGSQGSYWLSKKEGPHAPYTSAKTKEELPANTKTNQQSQI